MSSIWFVKAQSPNGSNTYGQTKLIIHCKTQHLQSRYVIHFICMLLSGCLKIVKNIMCNYQ